MCHRNSGERCLISVYKLHRTLQIQRLTATFDCVSVPKENTVRKLSSIIIIVYLCLSGRLHTPNFACFHRLKTDVCYKKSPQNTGGQDLTNFISTLFYTSIIRKICQVSPEY